MFELIAPYWKATVPLIVGAILLLLSKLGVAEQMTVTDAVTVLVTSFGVWLIPNKK